MFGEESSIFFAGLIAGLAFAISMHTGISPDEGGISLYVLEKVCVMSEDDVLVIDCGMLSTFIGVVLFLVGVVVAIVQISRASSWIVGLVVYGTGSIVGFLIVHNNLV